MQLLFLVLLSVINLATYSTAGEGDLDANKKPLLDKEDILQLSVIAGADQIVKNLKIHDIDSSMLKDLSGIVMKEMLHGAKVVDLFDKLLVWCSVNGIGKSKTEEDPKKQRDNSKSNAKGSEQSYLCLIENGSEKCYVYNYNPDEDISVEEHSLKDNKEL
ncbi:uncharacterized protein LOC133845332 [Drosophila sulfurigaster albostrigata]|uniref:uncharacterized protein LOC133845332 n=1 Tax=Drosophila sulfurigaster albostrigata TaxID=89887 RepID=UPI002D21A4FE|nr:uncharacterized protein LOC133845332 [Drosophila sulfurigaster albostrigata]XP_062135750.1 uncharacterized protein LOC133845332 [Drosophila sulfurigaster albostrigata]